MTDEPERDLVREFLHDALDAALQANETGTSKAITGILEDREKLGKRGMDRPWVLQGIQDRHAAQKLSKTV